MTILLWLWKVTLQLFWGHSHHWWSVVLSEVEAQLEEDTGVVWAKHHQRCCCTIIQKMNHESTFFFELQSWSIKNWKPRKTLYFFASGYLTKNSHEHWRDKHISPMCVLLCNMLRTTPTLSIFFLFYNLRNHCSC